MKKLLLSIVCLTVIIPTVIKPVDVPVIQPRGGGKLVEH